MIYNISNFKFLSFVVFVFLLFSGNVFAGEQEDNIEDAAFKESLKEMFPMTPEQIKEYQSKIKETQEATKIDPPTVKERTRKINLEPGGETPRVNIVPGYVASFAFFDLTGEPWPITSVSIGNPQAYSVERPEIEDGNVITIAALRKFSNSNLIVTLAEYSMPFSIQISTDIDNAVSTDALVAFRAEKRGPHAKDPVVGPRLSATISDTLISFLDNVPPAEAIYVNKSPEMGGVDIWSYNDVYYVRTAHSITWPAYTESAKNIGGASVYVIPKVPEIVISKNGDLFNISIEEG